MKIESIRIENFRCFLDETVNISDYTCFVGYNGAGKSTILNALNLFFRHHKDTATDLSKLTREDFHHYQTDEPIRITLTFSDLTESASNDLADYVRQGKLTVITEAVFSEATGQAEVLQYGSRLAFEEFKLYFEAVKAGKKVAELRAIFKSLRVRYPGIEAATTKADMAAALQAYEACHPQDCTLIRSNDQFYGISRGVNRLAPHIQWIFVPAAKDYAEEGREGRGSALADLLARTVRIKTDFSAQVARVRARAETEYEEMLASHQSALDDLSNSLQNRLRSWSHPAVSASLVWDSASDSTVRVSEPTASLQLEEGGFSGELARFGHGLQRSYLLTILQELASLDSGTAPTLIMAIEEPEIYQHPPQERYLADVLRELSSEGAQVICCTHSSLFIPGADVETIRLVREERDRKASFVKGVEYSSLAARLEGAGEKVVASRGLAAKLFSSLVPVVNEMFFCKRVILVEGAEDVAHILSYIELSGSFNQYRQLGCHIVPVGGKFNMVRPAAVALELGIPVFLIWDSDTSKTNPGEVCNHQRTNRVLQRLMGVDKVEEWPDDHVEGKSFWMWKDNFTECIGASLGSDWQQAQQFAEAEFCHAGGLKKNTLAIACAHERAWEQGVIYSELRTLVERIMQWAASVED